MNHAARRTALETQHLRAIDACRNGGPLGSGILARDEWHRTAIDAAETRRLCRDAGLLDNGNQASLRARCASALRHIGALRPRSKRSATSEPA